MNDSGGNTSVSPDLRTCCACRAYHYACDGLAFKFTGHVVDSDVPSPNPRRLILNSIVSKSTGRKITAVCFLCASVIVTLRCSRRHRLRCRVRFRMRLLAARGVQLTKMFVLLTTPTRCAHGLRSVYGHHPTTPKTKKDWSLKYPPEVRTQRARPPPRAAPCEPSLPSVSRMSLISDVNPKESDVFGTFLTQTQREGGRF